MREGKVVPSFWKCNSERLIGSDKPVKWQALINTFSLRPLFVRVYSLGFRLAAVFHLSECLASWNVKNIPPFDGSINTILSNSSQTQWRHTPHCWTPDESSTSWVKSPCYLLFRSLQKIKWEKCVCVCVVTHHPNLHSGLIFQELQALTQGFRFHLEMRHNRDCVVFSIYGLFTHMYI